ncbi:MAG: hypothetical protein HRT89_17150 [Lentisphaeria bacterium]|nr:hypothetical protein [Lentisphaeria bacterium]
MFDYDDNTPSKMVRISDLLHRALKAAIPRWYIVLMLAVTCASPVLIVLWQVHEIQVAMKQLTKDNPQVKSWTQSHIRIREFPSNHHYLVPGEYVEISNIGEFQDVKTLKNILHKNLELNLSDLKIVDISALEGLPIELLQLNKTPLVDISALRGMPLKSLYLEESKVEDISPLKGMSLEMLTIPKTVKDIEFLRSVKSLNTINYIQISEFWEEYDKTGVIPGTK